MNKLPEIHMFTDGACSGNPGPGGWGVILRAGPHEKELSGSHPQTTSNRMELTAAIEGLNALKQPSKVTVHADSQYVVKGITEWLPGWLKRNWRNSQGDKISNQDLWEQLAAAALPHKITWIWVKGHAGHPENERADKLAVKAYQKYK